VLAAATEKRISHPFSAAQCWERAPSLNVVNCSACPLFEMTVMLVERMLVEDRGRVGEGPREMMIFKIKFELVGVAYVCLSCAFRVTQ